MDTVFSSVIAACCQDSSSPRVGNLDFPRYAASLHAPLHEAGFAHSVETFLDGELVGGLYGVSLGGMFFGESMFAKTLTMPARSRWRGSVSNCRVGL
jgi:leucyl/phenylalanyl-tRNA--protein transferase